MAKQLVFVWWTRSDIGLFVRAALVVGASLVSVLAWAQNLEAQAPAGFARLQDALRIGDTVVVSVQDGTKVEGRLTDLSPSHIGVLVTGTRREIASGLVTRVQRKRSGILLGAVIGAGAGVPFGAFLYTYAKNETGSPGSALMMPILVGLLAGVVTDGFLVTPRTVYERAPQPQTHLSLLVGPAAMGARFSVSWR